MMSSLLHALPASVLAAVPPLKLVHDEGNVTGGFWEEIFFRGGATTSTPQDTDALFMLVFWFGVFWFTLLSILWVWWAIKYRRRPGVAAEPSPSHNTLLEIFWTIVPSFGPAGDLLPRVLDLHRPGRSPRATRSS
jgi:hypothetical protein